MPHMYVMWKWSCQFDDNYPVKNFRWYKKKTGALKTLLHSSLKDGPYLS